MADILKELDKYPVATRLSLNGTIIVGRDIAHAKLKERLDRGEDLPQYIKDHPIYYAGPAKTPAGMACVSMGRRLRVVWTHTLTCSRAMAVA